MKKKLFTLILAIATCGMIVNAATKYEINVAGVEVTSDNCSRITGGGIESGYAVYDASSNTLTCYNLKISRSGSDQYGIHNRKCDNLKIVFSGSCDISTYDNALKLERSTTISAASGSNTRLYSSARIVANLKSYSYVFMGTGNISIESDGYEAIKGDGTGSTTVSFMGKITAQSSKRSALSSFYARFQSGGDLRIHGNGSNASVSDVSMDFYGKETVLEPYGAKYNNNSINNSSGSQIKSETIYISDDYVALLKVNYFPDTKFIGALLSLYPKGYITSSDVNNRTSLTVSGKSITDLTGINYFSELTYLDCCSNAIKSLSSLPSKLTSLNCSGNAITSLTSLPSKLTILNCSNNHITTFGLLPNSLQELYCSNNYFSDSFTLVGCDALKKLDMSNNWYVSKITCSNQALTMLNVLGCNNLTTLDCHNNQLTELVSKLPASLQNLDCSNNKLSGSVYFVDHTALKTLNISNNPNITTLQCDNLSLTSLTVYGCTAMTKLNCYNNQLTELRLLPNSLKVIDCRQNQLSSLSVSDLTALEGLYCDNNKLTSLSVMGCNALVTLYCHENVLTSLDVAGCKALRSIYCSNNRLNSLSLTGCSALRNLTMKKNNIKSNAMTSLINSLPTVPASESEGFLGIFEPSSALVEGNDFTKAHNLAARAKRWIPKQLINDNWVEIPVAGDVNGDGKINVTDVTALVNMILGVIPKNLELGDINGDGKLNVTDVTALVNIILGLG